jgi:hypothetical protein
MFKSLIIHPQSWKWPWWQGFPERYYYACIVCLCCNFDTVKFIISGYLGGALITS